MIPDLNYRKRRTNRKNIVKLTVSVISSGPQCRDVNARFTTLILNFLSVRTHSLYDPKSKLSPMSDCFNLVAPASPIECLLYLPNVQTGTGMVDPARKFKCTTVAREMHFK